MLQSSFGMGFLFNSRVDFDKYLVYFIVIVCVMMIITWVVWKWWEHMVSSKTGSQAFSDEEKALGEKGA